MPTARAPLIFAIWPTAEPTAPDAAATTTVSPGLRLADIEQTRIRRHAGHAEHADRRRDRRDLRIDLRKPLPVGDRVRLPARARQHDVALGESRIVGGRDLAHRAAFHHAADRHRLRIGRPVAHAPAHIGIERQPDRAQQHLASAGGRHGIFLDAEVGRFGFTDGAGSQNDAFALGHGLSPLIVVIRYRERSEAIRALSTTTG